MSKFILLLSTISINMFTLLFLLCDQLFRINIEHLYFPFMIIIFIVSLSIRATFIVKSKKIYTLDIILLGIIGLITLAYLLSLNNNKTFITNPLLLTYLWAIPSAFAGIMYREITFDFIKKFYMYTFYISSTIVLFCILIPHSTGTFQGINKSLLITPQSISYICSLTFGIGTYFIFKSRKKFQNLLILFGLIINAACVFFSGGRGGAILLIVYIVYNIYIYMNNSNINWIKKFFFFISIILLISLSFIILIKDDLSSRSFSYITESGIDLGQTSGRDLVYTQAITLINNNLLFGYGPFNYYQFFGGTPHNIILELLLAGGIFGLVLALFFITIIIIYSRKIIKKEIDLFFNYLFLYPLVMLMFSGNFLYTSMLWYVCFYKMKRLLEDENKNLRISE